jgi:hypothetical protein
MKNIFRIFAIAVPVLLITACDTGFDELNTSKTGAISVDPAFVLNNAIVNCSPPGGTINYEVGIVQQMIASNSGVLVGANFNQINPNATPANWVGFFQNVIKYTNDVITRTEGDATRANLYNMARIIQAYGFMVLTDTYGNVPYSQGGKGYTEQNFFPEYDDQEAIYTSIISELTAASAALDAAGRVETADILYGGNVARWKRFGYSLLLRAGMRLSEVNPTGADAAVSAAFAGGVILANVDNAAIRHDANYVNPLGNVVNGTEAANFYMAAPFVDALKATNDPRLRSIAVRYVGAASGPAQVPAVADTNPANQFGMPMGSTDATGDAAASTLPGGGTRYAFSQADRARILKRTSPVFLVTAAQSNLLLAEASMRGWLTGAADPVGAAVYFADGVRAAMDMMALYDANSAVSATDRDAYILANPLNVTTQAAALQQINTEYWVTSFLIGTEAWSNWRRSNYPVLATNPFPGKTVDFITKLTYPPSETLVNVANVQAAIADQGGDDLDTKVWWDSN